MISSFPFKNSRENVICDSSNGQFNNLNLNQSNPYTSDAFSKSPKKFSTENKKILSFEFAKNGDYFSQTKTDSDSWNKSTKNLSLNLVNENSKKEDELKKSSAINRSSRSTLSLHIKAYESDLFNGTKECLKAATKKRENIKQIFNDSTFVILNPFEFPRQQDSDEEKTPEVSEYKAFQKLLKPDNQANNQQPLPQSSSAGSSDIMDSSKSDSANALSLKELLFVKSNNSIADRVKMFLPQIAKANAELEEADEETRQGMIMEQIEQLQDDSSSDESDSSENEEDKLSSEDEKEEEKNSAEGDHIEIIFTKFEERTSEESPSEQEKETKSDEDDFIIRRSDLNESKAE